MIADEVTALPLYPHLDEIAGTLATLNLLMLHAEPGAGKTTLVPWRLLAHKAFAGAKFLLLQPRRIAARAAAERIAALPAVKKELMGRYSRHYRPDDPRAAQPTAKTKKRR
jgi:HrpA-like RNA helicase